MQFPFQPTPLSRRAEPFNHPDWIFELKYDGFRALARIKSGRCQLISRNGNPFASFSALAEAIASSLPHLHDTVLDGEIVCLDERGHPGFNDLLFRTRYRQGHFSGVLGVRSAPFKVENFPNSRRLSRGRKQIINSLHETPHGS